LIAYDLFCGAGGASLGLQQAGYDVLGFDNWELAVESHIANGFPAEVTDLVHKDWSFVPTPDLLWASPPCQPFSAAGKRLGQEDERDCMPHFLRAVRQLRRPPVVVMENVQGLTYKKHTAYLEWIVWTLEYHGYAVEWKVLNAADYGVPQTRKRFILIARSDGVAIKWPDPTHSKDPEKTGLKPWVTMAEALGWVEGHLQPGTYMGRPNNPVPVDRPAPTIAFGNDFGSWRWLNTRTLRGIVDPVLEPAPTVTIKTTQQWVYERPATTVAGDTRIFQPGGHHKPGEQSRNAIRVECWESAVLQGFPRDYVFLGGRTNQAKLVGNAVPPPLARAIVSGL
jgi:DNA (cytosine-5)-methyltransferase 1